MVQGEVGLHHRGFGLHGQGPGGEAALPMSQHQERLHFAEVEARKDPRPAHPGHVETSGNVICNNSRELINCKFIRNAQSKQHAPLNKYSEQ